ncbi:MAG TPA: DUF5916 domain-containing protein [Gemmatimonadaceae bacterium]|nr:DUF5916 domain-containing protein [Gemmatimonadaceae bacterium]
MIITRLLALVALSATLPISVLAQNAQGSNAAGTPTSTHTLPVPSARAVRAAGSIAVDGKLDEAAWQNAQPITEFRQYDPQEGQPATERTEVRFLFDDDALYIGAMMYDKLGAAGVTSTVVRRDNNFTSDFFEFVIDSYHDHLSRAFFFINPSGSKQDQLGIGTSCCDGGWDPVYDVGTNITAEGWIAEIRIPFSQLRFSSNPSQTWGLQVRRFIQRTNEYVAWSWWGRTESGGPNRFGHLEGLEIPHHSRGLELLPYAMTKSEHLLRSPGDPFNDGSKESIRAGLDLKYLLTPNLTLDATFNPDFGQVEVDPAVVNLSAFETFFQERRPFFVSGSGVFGYGGFNCYFCSNVSSLQAFYSRRVGRAPTGADLAYNAGPYAEVPEAATILGAAKITGRTANGYTVGVMNAVTGRSEATVRLPGGGDSSMVVEPLANYFVGRLKKDYMRGDLVLGAIATNVTRDIRGEFNERLAKHATLLGTDFRYAWNNRDYSLSGNFAVSNVSGDSTVMIARQRASARFYQRPDRQPGHRGFFSTRIDSMATEMNGFGGYARLAKEAGNWLWETAVNFRNPSFETNDYSFLTSADYVWNNFNVFRTWAKPTSWYRNMNVIAGGQVQRNFDGDITTNTQAQIFASGQTLSFWNWSAFYIYYPGNKIDDRLLRGGPSVRGVERGFYSASLSTDSRKSWQLNFGPSWSRSEVGAWSGFYGVGLALRPSTRALVSFNPGWSNSLGKQQYVRSVADPTSTAFFGSRYVLADIRQRQLNLDTRINYTFSPNMTLELYAQPFFASAHYSAFKEFNRPRRSDWSVYGRDVGTVIANTNVDGDTVSYTIDPDIGGPAASFNVNNPDFNLRSLRGSAVFRWEYRPGSTLYFVWTQQRANQVSTGDFDFGRDREALFDTRPDNIFLIKASWWLSK